MTTQIPYLIGLTGLHEVLKDLAHNKKKPLFHPSGLQISSYLF